jgi:hypothetical protein
VLPSFKGFKDGKELLVMDIIIEFGGGESSRKECNRMNFSVSINNGENCCKLLQSRPDSDLCPGIPLRSSDLNH